MRARLRAASRPAAGAVGIVAPQLGVPLAMTLAHTGPPWAVVDAVTVWIAVISAPVPLATTGDNHHGRRENGVRRRLHRKRWVRRLLHRGADVRRLLHGSGRIRRLLGSGRHRR